MKGIYILIASNFLKKYDFRKFYDKTPNIDLLIMHPRPPGRHIGIDG